VRAGERERTCVCAYVCADLRVCVKECVCERESDEEVCICVHA